MDVIPGQAKDFPHTQGAGKGKVHCHIEFAVRTLIQGGADYIRIPDIPLLVLRLWKDYVIKRISRNDLPAYRLLERTAEKLDDFLNGLVANIGSGGLSCLVDTDLVFCKVWMYPSTTRGVTACTSISPMIGLM